MTEPEGRDADEVIARRRTERRRGTPPGREPAVGHRRTRRLAVLTLALVLASAVALAVVVLADLA